MYETVPARYDLLNRLMTLGFDRHWRKVAARESLNNNPTDLLDLCTGTGDLALEIEKNAPASVQLHALDFSFPMLSVAIEKCRHKGINRIKFIEGDAGNMPFQDGYFQAVSIGFGFRNLTFENPNSHQNVVEINRVLAIGGQLIIAETSQPTPGLYQRLISWTSQKVFPLLGGLVAGQFKAYKYLGYSSANFFSPSELEVFLNRYGFRKVKNILFFKGVAGVFVYEKVGKPTEPQ